MKKYKCPNCATEIEVLGDSVMIICGCKYEMIEQIPNNHIIEKEDEK